MFGDPYAQHTSTDRQSFEDRHRITCPRQEIRTGESRGAGTYDGNPGSIKFSGRQGLFIKTPVSHETFKAIDVDCLIDFFSEALSFTGMRTNSTGYGWKRQRIPENNHSLFYQAFSQEVEITSHINSGGTRHLTVRLFSLFSYGRIQSDNIHRARGDTDTATVT
jgi:hypothetical protein